MTLGERLGYHAGRLFRAYLAFAVCGGVLVPAVAAAGSPTCARPARICAGSRPPPLLTAVLAAKIAARVRTTERRRTPRREAVSDAELGLLLLTAIYVLLAFSGGVSSPVYPLVYAVVSFLVTFHRLVGGLAAGGRGDRVRGGDVASGRRRRPRPRRCFPATSGSSSSSRC